jgi:thiazole synthase
MQNDKLKIGKYEFISRLILGTGKYTSSEIMVKALEESGTELVTVAVRRVNLNDKSSASFLNWIDTKRFKILPNTAGCYTAQDAIRVAMLAREVGLSDMIKLEVIGDEKTLYPDIIALIDATKFLVKEGFVVMPYTSDDLVTALKLEDAGAACVMPLGAPIGSGLGILNQINIRMIVERVKVPVIVDAGVGTASDVAVAMELGCDGVLLNTGVALAKDPVKMASAIKHASISGRLAYLAGRIPKKEYATPSSPVEGKIQ